MPTIFMWLLRWLCPRMVYMVPTIQDGRLKYVRGDEVYKLIAAGLPFYVGNDPSRWEREDRCRRS